MANQLGKFSQNLPLFTKPPPGTIEHELHMDVGIKSNGSIYEGQRGATQPTVLAFYAPMAPTKVSADASSNGLGCRSRRTLAGGQSSIPCLMHYAKIEKEALAATWACETLGKRFSIETEHKPLVSLLGTKNSTLCHLQSSGFVFAWLDLTTQ